MVLKHFWCDKAKKTKLSLLFVFVTVADAQGIENDSHLFVRGGAPPTQSLSLGLVTADFVFVCKLSRQELVIFICFKRSVAPTDPEFESVPPFFPSLSLSLSLLVCVSGVWRHADLHLKGLWQVCEQKIVPRPLTKVSLNSGALPATMNNTGSICGTPLPQYPGVLLGRTSLEMQQCPHLVDRGSTPTTGCHSCGHIK